MDSPRFSRDQLAFLIGVPFAWGILLLFHPTGDGDDLYAGMHDQVTAWLVVHVGMMIFIPLMAVVIYLLVRGVDGTAARVSRIALVPFALFYTAWEVLMGIGTGVLVQDVNGLPVGERATGASLVNDFTENVFVRDLGIFASIGSLALIAAAISAGIALRRHAGAPIAVPVMLALSAFLITAHPPPFGPIGLGLFIVAVLLYVRSPSPGRMPASLGQPA